jgi:histone-lysine N-methyltransferase MLL3
MVVYKASELPFLSKQEREELSEEVHFCDEHCYFEFAMSKTNPDRTTDGITFANLEELKDWQERQQQRTGIKVEASDDSSEAAKPDEPFKHRGKIYKFYNPAMATGGGVDASTKKRYKKLNENDLTAMMCQMGVTVMPPRDTDDTRQCLFCHMKGDAPADGPARLLNYDVNKWVHLNCALWSEEVYETQNGALVNVETALKNGGNLHCKICEMNGATVKCFKLRCTNFYHVGCANKDRAVFFKNKSVYCHQVSFL